MTEALVSRIQELKKKRNAIILVHNYQPAEVQDVADVLGDSLDLSRTAAKTDADVIVFCGVHFMAETASILAPHKTVLLPEIKSGCPMADMLTADALRDLKKQHPEATVVAYVNTTAAVKAETDICCTSANAVKIVNSVPGDTVLFVPDRNLGSYVAAHTNKKVILGGGYCPIHNNRILPEHIQEAKKAHPQAEVIAHPECIPAVVALADKVLSTTGMCRYVTESAAAEFIVATETAILHRMRKDNPGKRFYPASEVAVCENMKKNSLEKVLWALEEMRYPVTVDPVTRAKALSAIEKMISIG